MPTGDGTPRLGRPKGSQNKLTRAIKDAFQAAFDDLQRDEDNNLLSWAQANPTDFYKLASKLIPSDINARVYGNLTATIAGLGKAGGRADDTALEE